MQVHQSHKQGTKFSRMEKIWILQIISLLIWEKKMCGLELQWKTGMCMLNTALCHFVTLASSLSSFWDEQLFILQGFLPFQCYHLVVAQLTTICSVFVICSVALKRKRMSVKQSRNIMSPMDSHRRSQEIVKQLFYTKIVGSCLDSSTDTRKALLYNATKPWKYGGDTVLCKQCQEVTCLLFVLQTKQIVSHIPPSVCARLCLHLVPTGYIDSVWVLVRSTSKHKSSE